MSKHIPGSQKHLTLEDRIYIENSLCKGYTFKDIAKYRCKDPTTIFKEVKAYRFSDWYHKGTFYNVKNFYIHRYHCKKTNTCSKILLCGIKCTSCHVDSKAGINVTGIYFFNSAYKKANHLINVIKLSLLTYSKKYPPRLIRWVLFC